MYPHGTIYERGKSASSGEVYLHAPIGIKIFYGVVRGVMSGFIGFLIIYLLFSFGPIVKEEVNYRLGKNTIEVSNLSTNLNASERLEKEIVQKEAKSLEVGSYFSVVIPKIGAKSNIVANVDSGNEAEYGEILKKAVAHAKGTYFPGQGRNVYLFSHSTNGEWNVSRYNAVFYLLRELEKGDRIIVFFADHKYVYEVEDKVIAKPNDNSWITPGMEEKLVLQTCDPPGTSWNRLLIIAHPVDK